MDNALNVFFSWQFIMFCLALATVTFVMRKVAEYLLETATPTNVHPQLSKFWTDLVMPLAPIFIGAGLAAIAKQYPYPAAISSLSGRVCFGSVAGLLSGTVYRMVGSFLGSKISQFTTTIVKSNISESKVTTTTTGSDAAAVPSEELTRGNPPEVPPDTQANVSTEVSTTETIKK